LRFIRFFDLTTYYTRLAPMSIPNIAAAYTGSTTFVAHC